MEDMASALGSILNNPQTMQQIMSLASQLGLGGDPGAQAPSTSPAETPQTQSFIPQPTMPPQQQPFSSPVFAPAQAAATPAPAGTPNLSNLLGNLDLGSISKISQIMGSLNTRDANVELLLALKPHFGEKRQKKVDDAIRIMQLVKVLPLLKETGIFGSLSGSEE